MSWRDQAPLVYVVISVVAAVFFAGALVVAIRRQPHRFQRIRRFLCCLGGPLQGYASVEEEDPFVIGDDEEQEIELPITLKSDREASTEQEIAATV